MIVLNIIEFIAAALGLGYFILRTGSHFVIGRTAFALAVACLFTVVMGFVNYDNESRWLFIKVVLFVLVTALSVRRPQFSILILIAVVLFQVSTSEGKSATFPLPILALLTIYIFPRIKALYSVIIFTLAFLILSLSSGLRSGVVFGLIAISIAALPPVVNKGLVRLIPHIMFIYIAVMVSAFALFIADFMPQSFFTASNIERSSMIFRAVTMSPEYIFKGPRLTFDSSVSEVIDDTGVTSLYESDYGVDPHNFILSLWKDEGGLVALIWLIVFVRLMSFIVNKHSTDASTRTLAVMALLVYPVVHFTLSPPSTDNRLMIAAFIGLSYYILDKRRHS